MSDPDQVLAKLREASRHTTTALEFLQTANDSEVLRDKMIFVADEKLKLAIDAIAQTGTPG